jgi:hypothetical protein
MGANTVGCSCPCATLFVTNVSSAHRLLRMLPPRLVVHCVWDFNFYNAISVIKDLRREIFAENANTFCRK